MTRALGCLRNDTKITDKHDVKLSKTIAKYTQTVNLLKLIAYKVLLYRKGALAKIAKEDMKEFGV